MDIIGSFRDQCRVILRAGGEPKHVIFSPDGYSDALRNADSNFSAANDPAKRREHFMGLPYKVDPRTSVPIAVLDTELVVPPVRFRVDQQDPTKTFAELAGQALTKTHLSDVIEGWISTHPGKGNGLLVEWVKEYGRFE